MSVFYGTKRDSQLNPSPSAPLHPPPYQQPSVRTSNLNSPPAAGPANFLMNMFQGGPDTPPQMRESIKLAPYPAEEPTCCTKYCSWATINYYRPYFSVTTDIVIDRIKQSLQFWTPRFFGVGQSYDLYGPFWIFSTLAFVLGAVPNILKYQVEQPFNYNFYLVGFALGLMYTEGFGFAALLVMLMRCMGGSPEEIPYPSVLISITYMICLYGYSHFITILAVLCCSINVPLLHYILLGYALASRLLFIIGNVSQLHVSPSKKTIVGGLIIGYAALMFLIFKFYFLKAPTPTVTVHNHHYTSSRHYFDM